jgi:hypothetical protein
MNRVRIINDKGQIKYVAKHIAENEKLLKQYGFTKQDLNEGREEAKAKWEYPEVEPELQNIFVRPSKIEIEHQLTEEQAREKYFEIFGKKAGNKKLENILKEIEEKQTAN